MSTRRVIDSPDNNHRMSKGSQKSHAGPKRWVNIFRIDDPVGTDIEPGGEWPENCPVEPKGHTDYWKDRQVLQILQDQQLV